MDNKDGYLRIGISPTNGKWFVGFEGNIQPIIGDTLKDALIELLDKNKNEVEEYLTKMSEVRKEDMSVYKISDNIQ